MVSLLEPVESITKICRRSLVGKLLPDALYIHSSALLSLEPLLQQIEQQARSNVPHFHQATLVKFNFRKSQVSYLFYPEFDTDPHPALKLSIQVDLETKQVSQRDYTHTDNPPVLHRKETFVSPDYPLYETFQHLTHQEVALGLLDNPTVIGMAKGWQQRLAQYGWEFVDHALVCPLQNAQAPIQKQKKPKIERHKAAIVRAQASKPIRLAVEAGLFEPGVIFFDYGCGHGADIEYIRQLNYESEGWDPHFRPTVEHREADIVNLGYIINVIEDMAERRQALLKAWGLTRKVLIVAAQVLVDDPTRGMIAYGDGIITSRNTFQKYYEQEELKTYIDQVLGVDAIPVALGIYFVFRDDSHAESFRASRFRSRATTPRAD